MKTKPQNRGLAYWGNFDKQDEELKRELPCIVYSFPENAVAHRIECRYIWTRICHRFSSCGFYLGKTRGITKATRIVENALLGAQKGVVRSRKGRFLSKPLSATLTVGMFASWGLQRALKRDASWRLRVVSFVSKQSEAQNLFDLI